MEELIEKWKNRPMSWSQLSAFRDWDKELWYKRYILGEDIEGNKRMSFGSLVGKRIESDPTYIPMLPREGVCEFGIKVKMGDIELVGFLDSYSEELKIINEFKTSSAGGWNQKKVNSSDMAGGQLTFYALLLYLKYGIDPSDLTIRLHHLHVCENGDFSIAFCKPFKIDTYITKRTKKDVLMFGAEILQVRKQMEEYARERLSTDFSLQKSVD